MMNDATLKQIIAVKAMVSRGSHVRYRATSDLIYRATSEVVLDAPIRRWRLYKIDHSRIKGSMNKTEPSGWTTGILDSSSQLGVLAQDDCTRKSVRAYVFLIDALFFPPAS
jgi:hypothetical protein